MKVCILVLVLVIITGITNAQRMLPKQKGLEIIGGILTNQQPERNYFLNLSMTVNARNGNYWIYGIGYDHELIDYKTVGIPLETYEADMGYSLRLLGDAKKRFNVNLTLTGIAGYKTVNKGVIELYDGSVIEDKEGFVYGVGGSLSMEYYITNQFVVLLQGKVTTLWGVSTNHFHPMVGIGFRVNF